MKEIADSGSPFTDEMIDEYYKKWKDVECAAVSGKTGVGITINLNAEVQEFRLAAASARKNNN